MNKIELQKIEDETLWDWQGFTRKYCNRPQPFSTNEIKSDQNIKNVGAMGWVNETYRKNIVFRNRY